MFAVDVINVPDMSIRIFEKSHDEILTGGELSIQEMIT